jgi:hypothetical protein
VTATVGDPARPTTQPPRQPLGLCAVVAVGVVVGWLAYDYWVLPRLYSHVLTWAVVDQRWWLVNLTFVLLGYLPFAAALLLWGRTPARRVASALIALGTAGYVWGLYQVFSNYVWGDNASNASVRVYTWAALLVAPTLCALAWGVARRWGRLWVVGLLVAPVVAVVLRELDLRWAWWHTHLIAPRGDHQLMNEIVVVLPIVAAALTCWGIDEVELRRAATGPTYDEGPPPR